MPAKIERVWLCNGGCHFNGMETGHVTEVVTLMEGEWSCYGGDQFKRGRMVMLQRWSLIYGEWSCYRDGQFNGGRIVMLQRWSV